MSSKKHAHDLAAHTAGRVVPLLLAPRAAARALTTLSSDFPQTLSKRGRQLRPACPPVRRREIADPRAPRRVRPARLAVAEFTRRQGLDLALQFFHGS